MHRKTLNVLMVGPLPPPFGGATVLFKSLVDSVCQRADIEAEIVSTSLKEGQSSRGFVRLFKMFCSVIYHIRASDVVSLHASISGLPVVGTVMSILTFLWRRPLIIHKFGGNDYRDYIGWRRWLAKWALQNTDIYLAETKTLVALAQDDGISHVRWFPNSRVVNETKSTPSVGTKCRRFVFVSQVCKDKGIEEIIEAGERFGEDISIDIYGPLCDGYTEDTFSCLKRVKYKGVLSPEDVSHALTGYDVFLLPTFHSSEGYSGAIIEAYMVGLPVICTRWRALPEIADDSCAILIEPHSSDQLYEAMKKLTEDDQLWLRLCQGATDKGQFFDVGKRADEFVEYCQKLADGGNFKDK